MTEEPDIRVERREDRYVVLLDGAVAGYTAFFTDEDDHVVFPHTQVDPEFAGHGLATTLIAAALADEAERGDTIVALCPFVVKYLAAHDVPGLRIASP